MLGSDESESGSSRRWTPVLRATGTARVTAAASPHLPRGRATERPPRRIVLADSTRPSVRDTSPTVLPVRARAGLLLPVRPLELPDRHPIWPVRQPSPGIERRHLAVARGGVRWQPGCGQCHRATPATWPVPAILPAAATPRRTSLGQGPRNPQGFRTRYKQESRLGIGIFRQFSQTPRDRPRQIAARVGRRASRSKSLRSYSYVAARTTKVTGKTKCFTSGSATFLESILPSARTLPGNVLHVRCNPPDVFQLPEGDDDEFDRVVGRTLEQHGAAISVDGL